MGLYKLRFNDDQLESGVMERATNQSIDYEKDFENWLENSPSVADFQTVPPELLIKIQLIFYSDPIDAIFKALGAV